MCSCTPIINSIGSIINSIEFEYLVSDFCSTGLSLFKAEDIISDSA